MINLHNAGGISGNPSVDNAFNVQLTPTPAAPATAVPAAGWHVELTDPIMYGTVTINGNPWTPPVVSGAANTVLTTDGLGNVSWDPAVHTISFGTTGLLPSIPSSNIVTVSGILALTNGGTGLTSVGANGTTLVSNGTALAYGYPARATNIAGGNPFELPYQTASNTTGFVAAGVTGQILNANTGAAPTWGSGTTTIGTTTITLGATALTLAGLTSVTLTQNPAGGFDAATKQYVDARTGALQNLGSAKVATTGNITRSGTQTIDGIPVVAGDLVLVWKQTNATENGLYTVAAGPWTYPSYADTWSEYVGALVFIQQGATYSGSSFQQTAPSGGTLGSTAMNWAQISSALQYVGGAGINIVGTTVSNTGVLSISGGTTGLTPSVATTGAVTLAGTLAIANGGTGLTALGTGVQTALGATPNAANGFVLYSGDLGTPTAGILTNATGLPLSTGVTGVLAIANGGTGQATANDAFNALAPLQTGNNGKFLTTDGVNTSWATNAGGTVTSVDVSGGTTGLTTSGGPITTTGTITLAGTLNIANGGTGQTSANAAFNALAPSQTSANGKFLTSDGTDTSWAAIPPGMVYPGAGVPVSTGSAWGTSITLGTGVSTALGVNVGSAGAFVVNGGALGTPASGNFSSGTFTWPTFNQNTTGNASTATTATNLSGGTVSATTGTFSGILTPTGGISNGATFNKIGAGGEGGELHLEKGATSTLAADVAIDLYNQSIRVFENGGTNRGAQLDISAMAASVGSTIVSTSSSNTTADIPLWDANGTLTDSGKYFSDAATTNNNIWSANQTQTAITAGLLNTPTLPAVTAATTANITLANTQTVDGIALVAGNYCLVKNQTTSSQNGVYRVVSGGSWVRQSYVAGAYADVSTETTYAQLNENGGVINVLSGTVNKNLQYQIYFQNPAATLAAGTTVYVTGLTKIPAASTSNRYVDVGIGNNTTNNGSAAFPYATIAQALVGMNFPATINVGVNPASEASSITWTNVQPNCSVQSSNINNNGGQTLLSGTMTFATGSTRNHFTGTSHSSATPFVFNYGAACRNYFQTVTISNAAASDWLGLNAGVSNWITLDDIEFANPLANAINLPAFTNPFTIYHFNQNNGIVRYTGTGAASTVIDIRSGCVEGYVWIPSTYLGSIAWNGAEFGYPVGSTAYTSGLVSDQPTLTTILNWTADTTYDGYYAINFASPSAFAQGAIFGKVTVAGVTTFTFWGRNLAQAPATLSSKSGLVYGRTSTGWVVVASAAAGSWASIYDTTASQTAAAINTAYAVALGNIDANSSGISLQSGTQMKVANAGVYTFAPSLQIRNSSGQIDEFNLWFRKNGSDLANSNSVFSVQASHGGVDGYAVPAVAFTAKLAANDYIELMWSTSSTAISIYTIPATAPAPAAPGVIVSVTSV